MKMSVIACAMLGATLTITASARQPANPEAVKIKKETAQSLAMDAEFRLAKKEMAQMRREVAAAAPAAALADTGDADSFGRNAKFIGLLSTGGITLADDCTPDPTSPPGPEDHCVVLNPAPAPTSFSIPDAARMTIPAKSAKTLFCHWQTPVVVYSFQNFTGVYQPNARFIVTPTYVVQNDVLNDPALIDPSTGLPIGGSITLGLSGIRHSRSLQPGENQTERETGTRACIGGLVSKRALMEGYGLTEAQANKFFKTDTTITMSLQGTATMVGFAAINYGTRFFGD